MISVCMATYNGEKYLREQVDSILSQLTKDDELIISDDGSTDSTIDILKSYNDSRIKIFINAHTHGVNGNFENALRHANGNYIFLSDQDDVWLDGKVDTCVTALSEYDCVIHDAFVVNSNLEVTSCSFFTERKSGPGFWKNLYRNTYLGCCMAFNRSVLSAILPIPITKSYYHDNWIGSIADLKFNLIFSPYKGILFRRHEYNTSCTAKQTKYNFFQQIKHRFEQLIEIGLRLYKM